jgi:thiol-disulfide isomerase/thioredoxin
MKRMLFFCLFALVSSMSFAQPCVEVSKDSEGRKQLVGIINRSMLVQDTAFSWFTENGKWFTPPVSAVEALKVKADSVQFIVIFGTWCHDSQNLLPQFFKWTDAAGYPDRRITLIAVDRAKKVQGNFAQIFGVKSTPTFIVMRNGREAGRVVEYGNSGAMVVELAEIVGRR